MKKRMSRVQNRIELLPMLFQEIQSNLLNFDEDWNPFGSSEEKEEFEQREETQFRLLSLMKNVELFLTKLLLTKKSLFEIEIQSGRHYSPEHKRPLEESFFSFNFIFGGRTIRVPQKNLENGSVGFCEKIQHGVDLELCLKLLGNITPKNFDTSYEHLAFNDGICVSRGAESNEPKKTRSRDWARIGYYPEELCTREPTFNHQKILNKFSKHLSEQLYSLSHTKQLNSVNSNALARHKRAIEYIDSLFAREKVLNFVTMDLCFYHEDSFIVKQKSLEAFKNGMKRHPLLNRMVGYLGKWEYSLIKETYIRLIFIFPKIEQHILDQLPEVIGALWVRYSVNGNFHRASLASEPSKLNQVICTISEKNMLLRMAFEQRAIYYLTHSQEYYRYKYNDGNQDQRYKSLPEYSVLDEFGRDIWISEPRDIFFKGELTGEALERKKSRNKNKKKKTEILKIVKRIDESIDSIKLKPRGLVS